MYLINKDETEHTGQVGVTVHRTLYLFFSLLSFLIILILILHPCRNPMFGKCTRSDAGTSFQPVTVSESNTRISSASRTWPVRQRARV